VIIKKRMINTTFCHEITSSSCAMASPLSEEKVVVSDSEVSGSKVFTKESSRESLTSISESTRFEIRSSVRLSNWFTVSALAVVSASWKATVASGLPKPNKIIKAKLTNMCCFFVFIAISE